MRTPPTLPCTVRELRAAYEHNIDDVLDPILKAARKASKAGKRVDPTVLVEALEHVRVCRAALARVNRIGQEYGDDKIVTEAAAIPSN